MSDSWQSSWKRVRRDLGSLTGLSEGGGERERGIGGGGDMLAIGFEVCDDGRAKWACRESSSAEVDGIVVVVGDDVEMVVVLLSSVEDPALAEARRGASMVNASQSSADWEQVK
jgi:hypothetical protein